MRVFFEPTLANVFSRREFSLPRICAIWSGRSVPALILARRALPAVIIALICVSNRPSRLEIFVFASPMLFNNVFRLSDAIYYRYTYSIWCLNGDLAPCLTHITCIAFTCVTQITFSSFYWHISNKGYNLAYIRNIF